MNTGGLYQVIVLALATAAISVTIAKARMFASVRKWIAERNEWLGDLASCNYCMSHWVSIAFVVIYRPVLIPQWIFVDLLVSMFVMVTIAAIVGGVIVKLNPFRETRVAQEEEDNLGRDPEHNNAGIAG